ncbi:hypothetical protein BGHDH14_bgh00907 [Blumeria hordei DH14]|uniref:Uncharacterized protein n=1 Tax=Blumeria graminis f. sp. hordei (strain DH14) TaxID=546991 RepID=N1JGS6_BLUG1|nr:hypothetical protein BGHDH14_bgh00907 [Blumeria hordei DH14]
MPTTQRPFLTNFLAAFRAHSIIQQSKASPSSSSSVPAAHSVSHAQPASPSQPRSITTGTKGNATALTSLHSPCTNSTSPSSRSPVQSSESEKNHSRYTTARRGSDSSSEDFRDVLGTEKWYIGGRTATGEEKYFKLGVVKRHRSQDRWSLDRLSL